MHYQNKLVKFLDTLVTVAKSSYTLEQKGETSAKNLAFAKEILFAVEDVEERLEYLHLYGRKIIEEYQRNTQEQEQQTLQKQQSSASGDKNKAKVVRKKRHFHPEMKQEILKPYSGPDIIINDDHSIVAKPMNESTRLRYKQPKLFCIKVEYPDCSSTDSESEEEQRKSKGKRKATANASSERKRKFICESTKKEKACTFVTYATKTLIQFRNCQTILQLI